MATLENSCLEELSNALIKLDIESEYVEGTESEPARIAFTDSPKFLIEVFDERHGIKAEDIDRTENIRMIGNVAIRPNMMVLLRNSFHNKYGDDATYIQIRDWELRENQDKIISMILNRLGKCTRIFARKCEILRSTKNAETKKLAADLLNSSHIQGNKGCKAAYVLMHEGEAVAALTMSTHKDYQWEIARYACKLNHSVSGGFSKLFKAFKEEFSPTCVMTYADARFGGGGVYEHAGFTREASTSQPGYLYVKGEEVLSRQKCQKHKLAEVLGDAFDPSASELVNMLVCGWTKMMDCGHHKFVMGEKQLSGNDLLKKSSDLKFELEENKSEINKMEKKIEDLKSRNVEIEEDIKKTQEEIEKEKARVEALSLEEKKKEERKKLENRVSGRKDEMKVKFAIHCVDKEDLVRLIGEGKDNYEIADHFEVSINEVVLAKKGYGIR